MTQGRDGISLAPKGALRLMGVARRLSVVAGILLFAAIVAATTGTSYAKHTPKHTLSDTVVVSNYGVAFNGSIETFSAGTIFNSPPFLNLRGSNTLLGIGTGPAGDAQSSLNGDIAAGVPLILLPIGFPNGFIDIFSPGSNGNSEPKNLIADPTGFDVTGVDLPQGVAFEDPFDGVHTFGTDILAVANTLPAVVAPNSGEGICGLSFGFSLGTITEYNHSTLAPGLNIISPFNNSPVNISVDNPDGNPATIGGCLSFVFGPIGLAFDNTGYLFAVNEAAAPAAAFVTVYDPGASGDVPPRAIIGLEGTTAGDLVNPAFVTAGTGFGVTSHYGFPDDVIFVTDIGDNSIKIFAPFTNCVSIPEFGDFCTGTELAVIKGGATKLRRPEGIVLTADDNLYVVNNNTSELSEFSADQIDAVISAGGTQNIRPAFMLPGVIGGRNTSKMSFPVGVTAPQFPPPVSAPAN